MVQIALWPITGPEPGAQAQGSKSSIAMDMKGFLVLQCKDEPSLQGRQVDCGEGIQIQAKFGGTIRGCSKSDGSRSLTFLSAWFV